MTFPHTIYNKSCSEIMSALEQENFDSRLDSTKRMAQIIYQTLLFNKALDWEESTHVFLARTPEELIEVFKLRSKVYHERYGKMGYSGESNEVGGLYLDSHDTCSAILYTKSDGVMTSTCRVIFDSNLGLPLEEDYALGHMRRESKNIAELSRLAKLEEAGGLGQEFKYLVRVAYTVMVKNGMDILVSMMVAKHYRYYKNFGGFVILEEIKEHVGLEMPFMVTAWDVSKISLFFKRYFLGIKRPNKISEGGDGLDQFAS